MAEGPLITGDWEGCEGVLKIKERKAPLVHGGEIFRRLKIGKRTEYKMEAQGGSGTISGKKRKRGGRVAI